MLDYLIGRMREPSTWVSLGVLFTGLGWQIAPEYWQIIAGVGMGLGGLLGTILRERARTSTGEIRNVATEVATQVVEETVLRKALKP